MNVFPRPAGWWAALAVATLALTGCGRSGNSANATAEQLQQSYAHADAPVKQEVSQVSAALNAGNYTAAIVTMNRVAQMQPANDAQKQAVGALLRQTRLAVQQNPKLNNPELYKATSELILRVHGEN